MPKTIINSRQLPNILNPSSVASAARSKTLEDFDEGFCRYFKIFVTHGIRPNLSCQWRRFAKCKMIARTITNMHNDNKTILDWSIFYLQSTVAYRKNLHHPRPERPVVLDPAVAFMELQHVVRHDNIGCFIVDAAPLLCEHVAILERL